MGEVVMRREEFMEAVTAVARSVTDLVSARNAAYAGADPLRCWRKRGLLGLLVRLEDKVHRFDTFLESGAATPDQWRELLQDIAGYALCGLVWVGVGSDTSVMGGEHD